MCDAQQTIKEPSIDQILYTTFQLLLDWITPLCKIKTNLMAVFIKVEDNINFLFSF